MINLLLTLTLGAVTILPDEITRVSDVAFSQERIFVFDRYSYLMSLDYEGRILATYNRQGPGPGEFKGPGRLAHAGGYLYVADMNGRSIHVFDENLTHLRETRVQFPPQDLLATETNLFITGTQPGMKSLAVKTDLHLNIITGFGSLLEPADTYMGVQNGHLLLVDDKVVVVHTFKTEIEIYDQDGVLLEKAQAPGWPTSLFSHVSTKKPNWWNDMNFRINNVFASGSRVGIKMWSDEEKKTHLLIYDLEGKSWQAPKWEGQRYSDHKGRPWRLVESPEGPLYLEVVKAPTSE